MSRRFLRSSPADESAPLSGSSATGGPLRRDAVPRSRVGGVWVSAVLFSVVLLLLLIFVLENGQRAEVSFFGAHGHLPMGIALLFAAVCGILLVALPGTGRIVQLRLLNRRRQRAADRPFVADPAPETRAQFVQDPMAVTPAPAYTSEPAGLDPAADGTSLVPR